MENTIKVRTHAAFEAIQYTGDNYDSIEKQMMEHGFDLSRKKSNPENLIVGELRTDMEKTEWIVFERDTFNIYADADFKFCFVEIEKDEK